MKRANDRPRISTQLPWTCAMRIPEDTRGTLLFGYQDCSVEVSEDGRKLGTVIGCMGGFLEVHIELGAGHSEVWRLDPRDVWRIVTTAAERARARARQKAGK